MMRRLSACILFASLGPGCAVAADLASMFSFGGFGTLGVVQSDEHRADFTGTATQAAGAGYTHPVSVVVDSRIAGQISATFNPRFSAVLQVISEQNYDATYRPHVEWANLKYAFTPDLSVRVGRTAESLFLVNDSRKIGYSNPWVQPPVELYILVPFTTNDGLDVNYRVAFGAITNTLQVTVGKADYDYPVPNGGGSEPAKSQDQLALVDSLQFGSATLRFSYSRAHLTIPNLAPIFEAFQQFGPEGATIVDRYDNNGRRIQFLGVSASYEPGDWFAMGEWGRVTTHSISGDRTGWYVSGGYRFGQLSPYVNFAQLTAQSRLSEPGVSIIGLPPPYAAAANLINGALNEALAVHGPQTTISTGVRWDFVSHLALKLQYDRIRLGQQSQGVLTNLQPGFETGGHINLVSATLDFVF
jgi:hypothetical protein